MFRRWTPGARTRLLETTREGFETVTRTKSTHVRPSTRRAPDPVTSVVQDVPSLQLRVARGGTTISSYTSPLCLRLSCSSKGCSIEDGRNPSTPSRTSTPVKPKRGRDRNPEGRYKRFWPLPGDYRSSSSRNTSTLSSPSVARELPSQTLRGRRPVPWHSGVVTGSDARRSRREIDDSVSYDYTLVPGFSRKLILIIFIICLRDEVTPTRDTGTLDVSRSVWSLLPLRLLLVRPLLVVPCTYEVPATTSNY